MQTFEQIRALVGEARLYERQRAVMVVRGAPRPRRPRAPGAKVRVCGNHRGVYGVLVGEHQDGSLIVDVEIDDLERYLDREDPMAVVYHGHRTPDLVHLWVDPLGETGWPFCRTCGVVRPALANGRPCRGAVHIGTRIQLSQVARE